MGIGNWELGIGNWELGIGNWELRRQQGCKAARLQGCKAGGSPDEKISPPCMKIHLWCVSASPRPRYLLPNFNQNGDAVRVGLIVKPQLQKSGVLTMLRQS
ncbi:MAG: hypothetical protein F6K47_24370 [Symploca sp. SIO2E6]|nr:hypothetical protein [Symploca sp. SIO2E6]